MCEVRKCSECLRDFPQTSEFFRKHSRAKGGLNYKCKECVAKKKIFAKEGYAFCAKCQKELPKNTDYFYIDKRTEKGFTSRCKICEGNSYAISGRHGLFDIKWGELKTISGIYKITCTENKKIYIGSAVNFCMRWSIHVDLLRKNKHENSYLQNAFNKYGFDSFKFEIIEFVEDINQLTSQEQYWIDKYTPFKRDIGFNILKIAGSSLGHVTSEITKKKLSVALGKQINQYDLNGNIINTFDSGRQASIATNKTHGRITQVANGIALKECEFIWLYVNGEETIEERLKKIETNTRKILQYDTEGYLVREWRIPVSEIAKILGKKCLAIPNNIMGLSLTVNGFMWRYREGNDPLITKIDSFQEQFKKRRQEGNLKRKQNK